MICVAISEPDLNKCLDIVNTVEMAEIRLDLTQFNKDQIKQVFSLNKVLVATCRPDRMGHDVQKEILMQAIGSGANYVDIELEAPEKLRVELVDYAHKKNCRVIISYHNFMETPGLRDLYKIADQCYELGADVAKLATMANTTEDNARLLALYSIDKPVVAIGMGQIGKITRIMAPLLGAEFTFAAPDTGIGTAPGQINYTRMKELLNTLQSELK